MTHATRWQNATPASLLLAAAMTLVTACSSSETPGRATGGTPATPPVAHSTVAVTLKEFGVTATPASVPAGHVTFAVQNTGAAPHELVVVKSDLDPDKLPQVDQKLVDVKQVRVITEVGPFDGGTRQELATDLTPGRYVLLCNVPSHYISGMYSGFTVTEPR